jgi:hypothetical protein
MIPTNIETFTPETEIATHQEPHPELAYDDDDEEWHIESDWDQNLAICGEDLTGGHRIPGEEVPDEMTCPKCRSVEKSVVYKTITSPIMRFKVWLVG